MACQSTRCHDPQDHNMNLHRNFLSRSCLITTRRHNLEDHNVIYTEVCIHPCTRPQQGRNSVVRVATGWTVRGSNPVGGEVFLTCPGRTCIPRSLLYNGYQVSFPGLKQTERDVDHPSHLTPRLKMSKFIPLLPLWTFMTFYRVNITLTFTFAWLQ